MSAYAFRALLCGLGLALLEWAFIHAPSSWSIPLWRERKDTDRPARRWRAPSKSKL